MKLAKTVAHRDSDIICMLLEPRVGHPRRPQSLGGQGRMQKGAPPTACP